MKTKTASHTPGPWQNDYPYIKAGNALLARIECTPEMDRYDEANARLIAAAPDLLTALQGVLKVADRKTVEFDAARAAIAKALPPQPVSERSEGDK